jgi:alkyl hydroperoxide reductase subunit AhpC
LQKDYDEFTRRDTVVIAISQEDKDIASAAKFLRHFGADGPPFAIAADLSREKTQRFRRTTTYLIDKEGVVREIFPAIIHQRPNWSAVLNRIDALD